jgi:hypothetical protein
MYHFHSLLYGSVVDGVKQQQHVRKCDGRRRDSVASR